MAPTFDFGRIRVRRDQADFLLGTLNELRHRLIIRRADAKSRGEETYPHNRMIDQVDGVLSELHRTMEEKGWPHGSA